MRIKTKGIIKKIALVLAGVVALSAVGFGVAKLVEFVKDDLKTISPVFDVGNLGTDGKFVDDESTLYTKEAFQCDGLQIKLDFDNQIEYQIYFYDDLDNFVESTEVLSAAYSETDHDGYARIVIIPTEDDDDKISLTERVTYPGQMTIKVSINQGIKYIDFYNKHMRIVDDVYSMNFYSGFFIIPEEGSPYFGSNDEDKHYVTSHELLSVNGGSFIDFSFVPDNSDYPEYSDITFKWVFEIFEFDINGSVVKSCSLGNYTEGYKLKDTTTHVLFTYVLANSETNAHLSLNSEDVVSLQNYIRIYE